MSEKRDFMPASWFRMNKDVLDIYGPQIGAYGVAVYAVLARHANADGQAYPSLTRMATLLKMSKSSVSRTLDALVKSGLITRTARTSDDHGHEANMYTLHKVYPIVTGTIGIVPQTIAIVPQTRALWSQGLHPIVTGTTEQDPVEQDPEEQERKPPLPPLGGFPPLGEAVAGSDAALGSFEDWWNAYPSHRRVAKKQCARLWSQQGLEARAASVLAHTQAMVQSPQWRAGKIPNTTTYLKEERYETPPEPGKKDTFSMEGVWALLDEQGFKYDQ